MKRKQITSLLLSTILTVSILTSPFAQMSAFAAEGTTAQEQETLSEGQNTDEGTREEAMPEEAEAAEVAEDTDTEAEVSTEEESSDLSGDQADDAQGDPDATDADAVEQSADAQDADASDTVPDADAQDADVQEADSLESKPDSTTAATAATAANAAPVDDFVFKGTVHADTEGQEITPGNRDGESSEELFAEFVEKSFSHEAARGSLRKAKAVRGASASLTGIERAVYNCISAELSQIAAGERASTVFEVFVSDLGLEKTAWTAKELGVDSVFVLDESGNIAVDESGNPSISEKASDAVGNLVSFDLSKIISALLADNPYRLYWYEKTQGTSCTGFGLSAHYDDAAGDYVIGVEGSIVISCPVAQEFSAGEYMVDTSIGQAVQSAVANAEAIVSKYSASADYDKLAGYKEEICSLVSYNHEAAEGGADYGNPWQLIWVFDDDPSTDVVCEGYSKAFKYLCDESDFGGDVSCITVTGTMSGGTGEGPHMWNIVRMEDEKNYLVDLTNSDSGSIGENGELFMACDADGSFKEGYQFRIGEENEIRYIYDEVTLSLFSEGELTLGESTVSPEVQDPLKITKQPAGINAKSGEQVSLHVEVNADNASYQWQWSEDGKTWEDCTFDGSASDMLSFTMEESFAGKLFRCAVNRGSESLLSDSAEITLEQKAAILAQGTMGKNITWTLDEQGNLAVEGTGAMYDYSSNMDENHPPIIYYTDRIRHIYISDGITHIGNYAFFTQHSVEETIRIPDSVKTIGDYAFSECSATGFSLPEGLVSIGTGAFKQSVDFGEITIPGSVKTIGESTFSECYGLKKVSVKGSVSKISKRLFWNCTELRSLELPDTVTEIGDEAFRYNYSLKMADLPDGIVRIGKYAFANSSFSELHELPERLTQIGEYAFSNTEISKITIPNGVTAIPAHAFDGSEYLRDIILPEKLSVIGAGAFSGCEELKQIRIPEGVSKIGENAFPESCILMVVSDSWAKSWAEANNRTFAVITDDPAEVMAEGTCEGGASWKLYGDGRLFFAGSGVADSAEYENYWPYIRSIEIGPDITDMLWGTFRNFPNLEDVQVSEDSQYYSSEDGVLLSKNGKTIYCCPKTKAGAYTVPSEVLRIEDSAFFGCDKLTSINFNNKLQRIGYSAFAFCSGLTELKIPESVYRIDGSAFAECENLKEITLSQRLSYIDSDLFYGCTSLVRVEIPETVNTIYSEAFANCTSLVSVSMPERLEIMQNRAFFGCTELTEIVVPEGVSVIHEDTFRDCGKLTSVSLPSSLTSIEPCAFMNCASLKSVVIASDVTNLGVYAFANCYSLEKVVLPDSLTVIPSNAFECCKGLKDISLPDSLASLGSCAFAGCKSLQNIDLPDGLTEIQSACFSGCESLRSIRIPDGALLENGLFIDCRSLQDVQLPENLASIPDGLFSGCEGLKSIDIPDTVTRIGQGAFSHCYILTDIQLPQGVESIGEEAFNSCKNLSNIEIPDRVDSIPYSCFNRCNSLESIKLPAGLKEIGGWAFSECSSLEDVIIPNGTKSIGVRAFQDCNNLAKIYIPGSVTDIDYNTFAPYCNEAIYGISDSAAKEFADNLQMSFVPVTGAVDGHVYRKWVTVKAATCTEGGSRKRTCEFCGEVFTEEVPAKGHKWDKNYTVDVKPTYTEEGTESIHCSVCGISREGTSRAVAKLPKPVKLLTISGIVGKTYNKAAQTQKIVVKDGSRTLTVKTDYVVSYKNNVNAGTASVTITGKGNYTGSVTKTFTIKKAPNKITGSNITRTYSSKAQSYALGVKTADGTPKYKASSRSVTVSSAGKATVKAKFIGKLTVTVTAPETGNYSKTTRKITITVNPTKTAIAGAASTAAGRVKVSWKKNAVGTGYQIQYSTSAKFTGAKSVLVTKNAVVTKTLTGLVKGKKYYVRLRTYKTVGGAKYYSGWSAVKAVTVRK